MAMPALRIGDGEVRGMLEGTFGKDWRTALPAADKAQRDSAIALLKARGATVRQVSRITGIGRGIVQKAKEQGE